MRIVWTRRYLRELAAIGDYIGERNPRVASRVVNDIHTKTGKLLSANPFIGRLGEIKGTRELVIPQTPFIVAYRVREEHVEILFVQHGAREWPDDV
ncbi:type II toxin-antitoxin system RelE/ParE family toxin [Rhizobium leguminosarum]|uniref:Type II toxin-antitoxin system RelE/ParE family toxin n=2 Tax=Rhizobium TaxID=379 RepID=A0A7Y2RCR8_9HYPH|nr:MULTISPECIES: type II toxin-antitoxin system RelE/ParE family toxin [Rhizobium]MBY5355704.1 type II toxin-antitoxin system RelE/ParE family toxin [Rhizobium leguminosarum]MBY5443169.1 type II toxin-antitoxin system RelE/ParE family toxin [Rhizobium leguminosarum]NDK53693.1 type II toxin-antitoxin system RelE/ParE family toxin [Rhizobium laguerreae]NNG69889.1 type II toxin-antitoxin system RelE/ParE family toxin [Rhizobium laguerreae]NNH44107.1 type II toxin-antitoxin system RelE/ParE family